MQKFPSKLAQALESRRSSGSLRMLERQPDLVDFASNDYLGFSTSIGIFENAHNILREKKMLNNAATGSRLLTGNNLLYEEVEEQVSRYHGVESALIFNSGYDANLGFLSCVPQREDLVLYDQYAHASIRDGISLGHYKNYKFRHNDLDHLDQIIKRTRRNGFVGDIFIITESVFSMDGDGPDLKNLVRISEETGSFLILDEAHSAFVTGRTGASLAELHGVESAIFARIITFGKGLGAHGAAVVGKKELKDYLVNFSRSLIYTTALPPHALATILAAYKHLESDGLRAVEGLHDKVGYFTTSIEKRGLGHCFVSSSSSIQCCIIGGNDSVKRSSGLLRAHGFNVKPILSPTVAKGSERLRFCIHSFNSEQEMDTVLSLLTK